MRNNFKVYITKKKQTNNEITYKTYTNFFNLRLDIKLVTYVRKKYH